MVDIIIKNKKDDILIKDCQDFIPLNDGTKFGDKKYCDLSFECKQIGMVSEFVKMFDVNGKLISEDYLCTGKYAKWEERSKDEEAS